MGIVSLHQNDREKMALQTRLVSCVACICGIRGVVATNSAPLHPDLFSMSVLPTYECCLQAWHSDADTACQLIEQQSHCVYASQAWMRANSLQQTYQQ